MIEFIRHAIGFCGEHWHPSLFTILMGGTAIIPAFVYARTKLKRGSCDSGC